MNLKSLCSSLRATSSRTTHSRRDRDTQPAPSKRSKRCHRGGEVGPGPSVRRSPRKHSLRDKTMTALSSGDDQCDDSEDSCRGGSGSESDSWKQVPECAYDLLYRCLDLNPATRITAELALQHSFTVDNR